jgi:hypothetical protein
MKWSELSAYFNPSTMPKPLIPWVKRLLKFTWLAGFAMIAALILVALAHFIFSFGNYPDDKSRYIVGVLLLFLFAPTAGLISYFARVQYNMIVAAESVNDSVP